MCGNIDGVKTNEASLQHCSVPLSVSATSTQYWR